MLPLAAQGIGPQWFGEASVMGSLFAPSQEPYTGTISLNASGALGVRWPISDLFMVGGKAGYQWMPGVMEYDESTTLSIDDDPVPAVIRHRQQLALGLAFIEPTITLAASSWHADLGVRVGYVLGGEMETTQQIIDPPGVEFENALDSGTDIPGLATVGAWAKLGISSRGRRIGDLRIEPGLSVSLPLTSMSTVQPFRIWSASATVRLFIDPRPALPVRTDTVVITDTIVVESNTETETRESIVIVGVDSTTVTTSTEIIRTITILRELRRTVGIGLPIMVTEAQALFILPDGRLDDRITLRVAADRHELHVADPHWPAGVIPSMPKEPIDTVITDVVDASFLAVQRLPSTRPIRWRSEQWDTCRIRFSLVAGGDADPSAWKVVLRDASRLVIDSLGGTGMPPDMIDVAIPEEVLRSLRSGGMVTYEFSVAIDQQRWNAPVSGSLTFEAMKERQGATYRWLLELPKQPHGRSDGTPTWTSAQQAKIERRRSAWSPILLESTVTPAP